MHAEVLRIVAPGISFALTAKRAGAAARWPAAARRCFRLSEPHSGSDRRSAVVKAPIGHKRAHSLVRRGFLAVTTYFRALSEIVRVWGYAMVVALAGGCVVHLGDTQVGSPGRSPARSGDCAPKPALSRSQVACLIEEEGVNQLGSGGAFNRAIGVRSMQDVVRHFGCLAEHESGRGRLACGIGGEGLLGINRIHLRTNLPGCADSLSELRRDHRANIRCAFGLYAAQNGFWHWGRPRGSGYAATTWGTNKACPSATRKAFPLCP